MGYFSGANNECCDVTYYRARANRSNWYNSSYGYPCGGGGYGGYGCGGCSGGCGGGCNDCDNGGC